MKEVHDQRSMLTAVVLLRVCVRVYACARTCVRIRARFGEKIERTRRTNAKGRPQLVHLSFQLQLTFHSRSSAMDDDLIEALTNTEIWMKQKLGFQHL